MIDYSKIKTTSASPVASSMIETFRAVGYSIETAIADIIDNSVSAGANNIWIDYQWAGSSTKIWIRDDGMGMDDDGIIMAMRPGSKNPLEEREHSDLGRFGLGLKTASFSQCRKFSVISKTKNSSPNFWCWDLDFVNQTNNWNLIRYCPSEGQFKDELSELDSGTVVIWWDLDRLVEDVSPDDLSAKGSFLKVMDGVKNHLSMVFHRFIESGLKVFFRGREIKAWEPFMIGFEGLQPKPETNLEGGKIKIKGFVLPHRSKLTPEQYKYGKGVKDSWTAHQGFYVYRNNRMLVSGDWLGFFKKEVHYDLCRIRVDLPNSFDSEWQIDIKKSIARPPREIRGPLLAVAKEVRNQALEVYRHKGKVVKRKLLKNEYFPLWEERVRHGKRFYRLNRKHPILKSLADKLGSNSIEIEKILQFIEETVPVPLISLQENENENPHGQPFEGKNQEIVKDTMVDMFNNLISKGKTFDEAKAIILNIEPFNFYPEYLEYIRK